MFTGIIDHCGEVLKLDTKSDRARMWIACEFNDLEKGESIAVNGVCLTVDDIEQKQFVCDVSPETMQLTTLQNVQMGHRVNLERAMRLNDRVGGHMVQGHIDQVCQVSSVDVGDEFTSFEFNGLFSESRSLLVKKGSIAVNGVSLTLNSVSDDGFQVMLIPHTLKRTTFDQLKVTDSVNIEFDMLGKFVINHLKEGERQ